MAIWGHRDSERPAEEADEAQPPAEAEETQSPAEPDDQAGGSADESAPAFWRAQAEEPGPLERAFDDAPPREYGHVPTQPAEPAETIVPAGTMAPAETMAPRRAATAGTITSAETAELAETVAPTQTAAPVYGQQAPAGAPAPAADGVPIVDESPATTGAPDAVLEEEIVVIDAETAVKDPALTETVPDTATEATPGGPGRDPELAGAPGQPSAAQVPAAAPASPEGAAAPSGISAQRWSEIMATFVDDPRGSVKMAADAVDSTIEEVVSSMRARQESLASFWQGGDTDTEQLRIALREYRRFAAQVQQLSPSGETGTSAGS